MSKLPLSPLPDGSVNGHEQRSNRGETERTLDGPQAMAQIGAEGNFKDRDSRLLSFKDWPYENKLPAESLAERGYWYQGHEDRVICSSCDGQFGGLKDGDDPDKVHAEQRPDCTLLRQRKGNTFVKQTRRDGLQKKLDDNHQEFMKDVEESRNKLGENTKNLIGMIKEKEEEIRRHQIELQEAKQEIKYLHDRVMQQKSEIKSAKGLHRKGNEIAEKNRQLILNIQGLEAAYTASQRRYEDLSDEKNNVVDVLLLQIQEMNKLKEKYRKLSEEHEGMKRKYEAEIALSPSQKACMEMGYSEEKVRTATKIYKSRKREAEELMKILMEMDEERQCSQPSDRGQLAIGSQRVNNFVEQGKVKHLRFTLNSERVKSFRNWPNNFQQDPEALAEAGMFYTGQDDHTRCFFCGICLGHWLINDEPWYEHARWSPTCGYIRQTKGQGFIDFVQTHSMQQQEEEGGNSPNAEEHVDVAQAMEEIGNQLQEISYIRQDKLDYGEGASAQMCAPSNNVVECQRNQDQNSSPTTIFGIDEEKEK